MPTRSAPGYYHTEVSGEIRPIQAISPDTLAAIVMSKLGKPDTPQQVTSFAQYERMFGKYRNDSYSSHAMRGFFENGGQVAWVVRCVGSDARNAAGAEASKQEGTDGATGTGTAVFTSTSATFVANKVVPGDILYVSTGVDVGAYEVKEVHSETELEVTETFTGGSDATYKVYGTSTKYGHLAARTVSPGAEADNIDVTFKLENGGQKVRVLVEITETQAGVSRKRTLEDHRNLNPGTDDENYVQTYVNEQSQWIDIDVAPEVEVVTGSDGVSDDSTTFTSASGNFVTNGVDAGDLLYVTSGNGIGTYIVQSVTNETTLVVDRIITSGTAQDYGVYGADHDGAALKTMLASDVQIDLYGGVDDDPIDTDIQGSEAEATGLHAFDRKEKVRLLIIPDAHLILDSEGASATADIHDYAMAYCEGRDELFYLYSSDYGKTPTTVQTHFDDMADDSKLAAFYWPWIRVSDPLAAGGTWVPTVGHQAGMFARVHSGDQPYKGLANEKLVGALELEYECSQAEQGPLNEKGINVVRIFDGAIRTMGARTISTDPEWIYIHKRLTYIMIWTSIKEALQGLLFSVNDERLWGKIIASVRAFARTLDRRYHPNGALRNPVDPEADPFYIVCDESLNPPESSTVYYKSGWCIVNCAEVIEEMSGLWDGGYSHTEL